MGTGAPISEDCLYLNVVTAAKSSDEKLPVMVFYHGGGLTSGTASSTTYNHPGLPKYPRLPVRHCKGYEKKAG